mmetsp:Transcript_28728/g.58837  ORF Transcript_28728/g.58837 Transcript_28728/m.58837 type:complete len:84 (-) Transcript_28728:143-394(-)
MELHKCADMSICHQELSGFGVLSVNVLNSSLLNKKQVWVCSPFHKAIVIQNNIKLVAFGHTGSGSVSTPDDGIIRSVAFPSKV